MNNSKKEPRCLIMCCTPLQMLIAEKIIELHSNNKFDLLVVAMNNNDKYRYYYNKLEKMCLNSLYYYASESGLDGFLNYKAQLKKNQLNKNYHTLYLASIDNRQFQYIISRNQKSKIFTFDDGVGNIIPDSVFYSDRKPNFFKRLAWRIFGIKYYTEDIKKLSLLHYTIYKDVPNIIKKTQFIKIYSKNESKSISVTKKIRVYLGQPLEEISSELDNNYVIKIIEKLNIDFYYPHPREKSIPTCNFKVIESPLVFEDYIVSYLEENPETMVEIYSFISGAMLNIASLDHVNLNYIYNSYLYDKYRDFYDFSQKEFNIKYLEI